ncbi:MAG: 3-oxoacyl-[acyl-carrier-protein] reductase [Planctomycetota bacterium]|jgi:3-oxoacyl-[acyl-carrier protein] reductase|nr:3-oxoacyl-[acyl-carrier-protein] reductase [Planctomycetota bacterium]MDP6762323.1 3-oxoacyl-[acyl-carrier-protein] reductase [Planctomycetota bacterium]MDP6989752.1 3-oxoacyl-[acyl-carrier-protein] reductase [Planctomycetota bacterium]
MSASSQSAHRPLEGRAALVTGASRGIGRAIAERLAGAGARVACVATDAANCEEVVDACAARTDGALAYGVDVGDTDAVASLVGQITKEFGGLDILVNNAGVTRDQLLLRMSEEDFDRVIEVNLKGAWNFLKAAARPLMKARGKIVNISSVVGLTGNAGQVNYAASKAGIHGMTRSLAKELAGRAVCVNAVAPGFVATDMTADLAEGAAKELEDSIPLGRVGTPDEVAAAVEFLIGPGGDYITGQVVVIDGGLSL